MKRVLIVDDALIAQVILERILTSAGYEVAGVVSNGNQACDALRTTKPDLVLLDISIPGKGGMQVLKEMKAEFPEIPVVMCSALRLDTKVDQATELGAQGYVVKPINSAELLSTLEEVFQKAA
jgi:CheY-like chemotaxis protein